MGAPLPYDKKTEDVVLGSVIHNPEDYDSVAKFFTNKDVFYQPRAQLLWQKLTEMKKEGQHIDTLTVCTSLSQEETIQGLDKIYITDCTSETCTAGMTEFYANKVYQKYLLRQVILQSEEIKEKAQGNSKDVYQTIGQAHSLFGELLDLRPSVKSDINKIIEDTLHTIENKESKLIKTGYASLDKFAGGLTRGEITIVGGRPGHGKTTVLINILANVLESGYKAMFFSRELPNSELLKKIICLESQELSYSMVRKNVFNNNDLEEVNSTLNFIKRKYSGEKFLMFDNIRDFSVSASEIKKFKPDIIFDDYIQLISYEGKEDQRRLQIEQLVNDYKWLAKETGAVVVLASQLNRGIEYRGKTFEPQLSDLAESGAIEQVAENVFFTYYDYKVNGENGKGKNVLTISAGKVRYGDSGSVDLGYQGNKCKIFNSIEEMIDGKIPF
tara:strand:- start:1122 stop:2447 length:1326 start_codon:yes stop_codon:yes gene_type:complete